MLQWPLSWPRGDDEEIKVSTDRDQLLSAEYIAIQCTLWDKSLLSPSSRWYEWL